jgi:glutamyl-tRNA reductase
MRLDEGIFCVGVDQHATPLTVRESLTAGAGDRLIPYLLEHQGASEGVFLSTCNRVEIYGRSKHRGPRMMESLFQSMPPDLGQAWRDARGLYLYEGISCWRHLAEVATGLRSMVIGENEILRQVRLAYASAGDVGGANRGMHALFQSGLRAARAARAAAGFGRGDASVGRLAAEALHEAMQGRESRPLLLLGSGHTARSFALVEHKRSAGVIWISSRSEDRARLLAKEVEGEVVPWARWQKAVEASAVVVSALAGGELSWNADLSSSGPELLIDLGVPRTMTAVRRSFPKAEWVDLEELSSKTEIRPEALGSIHRAEEVLRAHEILFAVGKKREPNRTRVGSG